MNLELKYRPEIDGLRTIAVLGVICFHLKPEYLKGGFLGVDVFFVISGFLMASILIKQFEENRFSFLHFWKRRFKRLYPALAVTVCVTLVAGALILPNPERGALQLQSTGALFSFSNILLWKTTGGYWSLASENISLLHTWSLSLEEQFYVLLPILLFLAYHRFNKQVGLFLITLCVFSFILCVGLTDLHRSSTFYLLHARMWELLIGSILAYYRQKIPIPRKKSIVSGLHLLAMGLIFGSYFLIKNNEYFPGALPLFSCAGTFLLLWSGETKSIVTRCLSFGPIVYIGRISYSLYLWHWPIFVYSHYVNPSPDFFLLLLITFVAAVLSFHLVEQPLRNPSKHPRFLLCIGAGVTAMGFLILGSLPKSPLLKNLGNFDDPVSMTRGWQYEARKSMEDSAQELVHLKSPVIAVIGSSHARVICKPIEEYAVQNGFQFVSLATSGIGVTSDSPTKKRPNAAKINELRMEILRELKPEVIVEAGMWSKELLKDGRKLVLQRRLKELDAITDRLLVIGQVPLIELPKGYKKSLQKFLVMLSLSGKSIELPPAERVSEANKIVRNITLNIRSERLHFIDPIDILTTESGHINIFIDNMFLYSDYHHLNDNGATFLFEKIIKDTLNLKSLQ